LFTRICIGQKFTESDFPAGHLCAVNIRRRTYPKFLIRENNGPEEVSSRSRCLLFLVNDRKRLASERESTRTRFPRAADKRSRRVKNATRDADYIQFVQVSPLTFQPPNLYPNFCGGPPRSSSSFLGLHLYSPRAFVTRTSHPLRSAPISSKISFPFRPPRSSAILAEFRNSR